MITLEISFVSFLLLILAVVGLICAILLINKHAKSEEERVTMNFVAVVGLLFGLLVIVLSLIGINH